MGHAAEILVKAGAEAAAAEKAAGLSQDDDQAATHEVAISDMELNKIVAKANSGDISSTPAISEEEAEKQVKEDFQVDAKKRAAATREARDMIAKERAEARVKAEHAAVVHEIAAESPEQLEHEAVAREHEETLKKL